MLSLRIKNFVKFRQSQTPICIVRVETFIVCNNMVFRVVDTNELIAEIIIGRN